MSRSRKQEGQREPAKPEERVEVEAVDVEVLPASEVVERAKRRTFTAEYKLRILEQTDGAGPGEVGRILRREGLYSSHLVDWRRARREGALGSLAKRRGRKAQQVDPSAKRVAQLERENARLREELRKAELIIEVQGKVAGLLGFSLDDGRSS